MVRDIYRTLVQVEQDVPNLREKIEAKLADPSGFKGTEEQHILQMAITSVIGEGRVTRARAREVPLNDQGHGGRGHGQWASCGDDPASITDRAERMAILEDALRRELDALSDLERLALKEVYFKSRRQADVAREFGLSLTTLNTAKLRAIGKLAFRLQRFRDDFPVV